jgi:hypothetical protein
MRPAEIPTGDVTLEDEDEALSTLLPFSEILYTIILHSRHKTCTPFSGERDFDDNCS